MLIARRMHEKCVKALIRKWNLIISVKIINTESAHTVAIFVSKELVLHFVSYILYLEFYCYFPVI